jgi:hypothetical protein
MEACRRAIETCRRQIETCRRAIPVVGPIRVGSGRAMLRCRSDRSAFGSERDRRGRRTVRCTPIRSWLRPERDRSRRHQGIAQRLVSRARRHVSISRRHVSVARRQLTWSGRVLDVTGSAMDLSGSLGTSSRRAAHRSGSPEQDPGVRTPVGGSDDTMSRRATGLARAQYAPARGGGRVPRSMLGSFSPPRSRRDRVDLITAPTAPGAATLLG